MGGYSKYVSKRVGLTDVLEALDEKLHTMTRAVFRGDKPPDNLTSLVGKVQGMEEAIKHLEYQFGDKGITVPE